MNVLRNFALKRISMKHIVESSKSKFIFVILQNILIGALIAFPLVMQLLQIDEKLLIEATFPQLYKDDSWVKELSDCKVKQNILSCNNAEPKEIQIKSEHVILDPKNLIDSHLKGSHSYLQFKRDRIDIHSYGINIVVPYNSEILKSLETTNAKKGDKLLQSIATAAKPHLILPAMQFLYPLSIVLNFIFIAIISLFSLPMKLGATKKLTYKQIFSMLSYAATIPAIFAFLIGSILSAAFVYTIYNFGLIFFGYFLYKRYLK